MITLRNIYGKTVVFLERFLKTDIRYLVSGSFWLNLNFITTSLLSFVLSILFAHFLSKNNYGTYQYIVALSGIVTAFTLTGMNPAVTRAIARSYDGTFWEAVRIQIYWSIPAFIISCGIGAYYLIHQNFILSIAGFAMAIFLPISLAANTYVPLLYGKKDFRSFFLFTSAFNTVYYVAMAIVIISLHNIVAVILTYFAALAVGNSIACFLSVKKYKPRGEQDPEAIPYGKHLSLMNIITLIAAQIDSVLVFHFLGPVSLATYAFAQIIPDRLGGVFKNISAIALPKYAQGNEQAIRKSILPKIFKLLVFIFITIGLYIILVPYFFNWFFPKYLGSVIYSQVYILTILVAAGGLPLAALTAHRFQKELYIFNTVNSIVSLILLFVLLLAFGLWGIIIARIISTLFYVLFSLTLFMLRNKKTD